MIDKKEALNKIKKDINKLNIDNQIILKSFKKDRVITLSYTNNQFCLIESGFIKNTFYFENKNDFFKQIKKIFQFEFETNNKLWYSFVRKN